MKTATACALRTAATYIATGVVVAILAYSLGQDGALDRQLEETGGQRLRIPYEKFLNVCGNTAVIRKVRKEDGHIYVEVRTNEWLRCINDRRSVEGDLT